MDCLYVVLEGSVLRVKNAHYECSNSSPRDQPVAGKTHLGAAATPGVTLEAQIATAAHSSHGKKRPSLVLPCATETLGKTTLDVATSIGKPVNNRFSHLQMKLISNEHRNGSPVFWGRKFARSLIDVGLNLRGSI